MFLERASVAKMVARIVEVYLALVIIKPGEREITVASIILAAVVVAVIEAALWQLHRRVQQAVESGTLCRTEDFPKVLAQALERAQAAVKVVTYSPPAGQVQETLGIVRGVSNTEASSSQDFRKRSTVPPS